MNEDLAYRIKELEVASSDTLDGKIYSNNMKGSNDYSLSVKEVVKEVTTEPNVAFYGTKSNLQHVEDFACKFSVAWESNSPLFVSFALPKWSPYSKFLSFSFQKQVELGIYREAAERSRCNVGTYESLGMEKLLSIFIFLALCYVTSVILGAMEGSFEAFDGRNFSYKDEKPKKMLFLM